METKTQTAINYFRSGRLREAFKIFSKFRGFEKDEKRCIQIAYECMSGNEDFYLSLGLNIQDVTQRAITAISSRYDISLTLHH